MLLPADSVMVDEMLTWLAEEQRSAPELLEGLELGEVRWHLERVAINPLHQHDDDGSADRAARALAGCTDDTLETLLSCSADRHDGVAGSSHGRCTLAPALHHARGGVAGTFEYAQ